MCLVRDLALACIQVCSRVWLRGMQTLSAHCSFFMKGTGKSAQHLLNSELHASTNESDSHVQDYRLI